MFKSGADGDRTRDLLNAIQALKLLTLILIRLAETLVAYCVTKSQEVTIRLRQNGISPILFWSAFCFAREVRTRNKQGE